MSITHSGMIRAFSAQFASVSRGSLKGLSHRVKVLGVRVPRGDARNGCVLGESAPAEPGACRDMLLSRCGGARRCKG